jgi:hypothetical protein
MGLLGMIPHILHNDAIKLIGRHLLRSTDTIRERGRHHLDAIENSHDIAPTHCGGYRFFRPLAEAQKAIAAACEIMIMRRVLGVTKGANRQKTNERATISHKPVSSFLSL